MSGRAATNAPPLWYVGTTRIGRLGDEDCPETVEEAAEAEARSRRRATRLRLQTVVSPSNGCWVDTRGMTPADKAAYEELVRSFLVCHKCGATDTCLYWSRCGDSYDNYYGHGHDHDGRPTCYECGSGVMWPAPVWSLG